MVAALGGFLTAFGQISTDFGGFQLKRQTG
jgi:hypothetical protein